MTTHTQQVVGVLWVVAISVVTSIIAVQADAYLLDHVVSIQAIQSLTGRAG